MFAIVPIYASRGELAELRGRLGVERGVPGDCLHVEDGSFCLPVSCGGGLMGFSEGEVGFLVGAGSFFGRGGGGAVELCASCLGALGGGEGAIVPLPGIGVLLDVHDAWVSEDVPVGVGDRVMVLGVICPCWLSLSPFRGLQLGIREFFWREIF